MPLIFFFSYATKHDQAVQTRWTNGKIFGHQTMSDGVWSPSISRLYRPCRAIVKAAVHWCVSFIIRYIGYPDDLFRHAFSKQKAMQLSSVLLCRPIYIAFAFALVKTAIRTR